MTRRSAPLGAFFTVAGALHLLRPRMYEAIMPPWVPRHREMVLASGVAEIAGGVGALVHPTRAPARWGLVALLLAVFPANVHMAVHPDDIKGLRVPRWLLWARLPLQAVLVGWVLYATSED